MFRLTAINAAGDRFVGGVERLLALGLVAGILLDFCNVIGRYTGRFSMLGVDELEIYILIWIAFLGAIAVTWRGRHLRMDMLLNALPRGFKMMTDGFETLVAFAVTGFVAYESYAYVAKLFMLGSVSDILGVPTWIPHSAVTVSLSCIAFIALLRGMQRMRRLEP